MYVCMHIWRYVHWIVLVVLTFLMTSCGRLSSPHHLSRFPSNWLLLTEAEGTLSLLDLHTYCTYVCIRTNASLNVSYIVSLTVSSLLRTFFTANSLMTESTSSSNTSALILTTFFSDDRMVRSRGFSTLRPLANFWKCKVKTPHTKGAPWQDSSGHKANLRMYICNASHDECKQRDWLWQLQQRADTLQKKSVKQ